VKVLFIYIGVVDGFSGQAAATELIMDGFRAQGIGVFRGLLPHFNRTGKVPALLRCGAFSCRLIQAYWRFLWVRLPTGSTIHLSLGQTRFALLRDGVALWCASAFNPRSLRRMVALNGSVFTKWPRASLNARIFRWIIGRCDVVTCVGVSHAEALQALGVPAEKIEVVPNVCEYDGIEESELVKKQAASDQPIELLFLSSLTETKGYPNYLEALEMMSVEDGPQVHAVLCGPIMMDAYRQQFNTAEAATKWIEDKLAVINQSGRVQLEWIRGARGAEKQALFKKAHIFVLPTQYPVEAQPLVIIEAMAHGCAIVTTDVGELPATVDGNCAIIQSQPTEQTVKQAMDTLIENNSFRLSLAKAALSRFKLEFNRQQYVDRWREILTSVCHGKSN
jgi:glycosyltransferase involved in cell wall biosynthesis